MARLRQHQRRGTLRGVLSLALVATTGRSALAACNIIPGTSQTFRGALGSADRPFAGPGDFVELHLNPCDKTSAGFSLNAAAQVVTVMFTPPNGPRNAVILTTDCAPIETKRQSCAAVPNVASATCVAVNQPLQPIGIGVVDLQNIRRLRFRFPNTGGLGGVPEHTFSGPATIAVTAANEPGPLPCDLANTPCAGHAGVLACIDSLLALDGTCGSTLDPTFGHFTALPPPNNFQAVCTDPHPPCNGDASEVRFTVDAAGNLLMPMDWRGILLGQGVPIARLLQASASVEAFVGGGQPIRVPSNAFLLSCRRSSIHRPRRRGRPKARMLGRSRVDCPAGLGIGQTTGRVCEPAPHQGRARTRPGPPAQ